jgi:hypothetical protein
LKSPLIKPVQITINENNIPVNLYGDDNVYKCIPDIGEEIKDSILIALRREKKEEMVFTEAVERLRKPMMSDDKKLLTNDGENERKSISVSTSLNTNELKERGVDFMKQYYDKCKDCSHKDIYKQLEICWNQFNNGTK